MCADGALRRAMLSEPFVCAFTPSSTEKNKFVVGSVGSKPPSAAREQGASPGACPHLLQPGELPGSPGESSAPVPAPETGGAQPISADLSLNTSVNVVRAQNRLQRRRLDISSPTVARTSTATALAVPQLIPRAPLIYINSGQIIFNTVFYPAPTGEGSQAAGILYNPIFHSSLSIREKERDLGSTVIAAFRQLKLMFPLRRRNDLIRHRGRITKNINP